MKLNLRWLRLILILCLVFVPSTSVFAQSPDGDDIVLFGQNYTVENGETLNNAIAIFGGNLTIEEGATVNGDIILFGGNIEMAGNTKGDIALIGGNMTISGKTKGEIVLFGGQIKLTETAFIDGNISMVGGNVDKEEGAEITGEVKHNETPVINPPDKPNSPNFDYDVSFNPFWEIGSAFAKALVVAAIGMLLMLFWQPQLARTGNAIISNPFIASGFGLLTLVALPIVLILMVVTILLIPITPFVLLFVLLAWLFGTVALGQEVGERFTRAINQTWAPVLSTGFGTFMLVLLTSLIGLIPCVGWLPALLFHLVALGGVAMTWFGTRNIIKNNIALEPPATE